MRKLGSRCLRAAGVVVVLASAACGDDRPGSGPDAGSGGSDSGSDGHDIRVELSTVANAIQNDQLVALQDGDGAWVALTGSDNVYTAHITSERFGVAVGCIDDPLFSDMQIRLQAVSDGTTVSLASCQSWGDLFTISGSLDGVGHMEQASVRAKSFASFSYDATLNTYSMDVPPGTTELFALTRPFDDALPGTVIRTGVDVTADTTVGFDFASDGVALDAPTLTGDASFVSSTTSIVSAGDIYPLPSDRSTSVYRGATALLRDDDFQVVRAQTSDGRMTTMYGVGGPLAVELAAPYVAPTATLLDTGYLRPSVTFPIGGATLPVVEYDAFWSTIDDATGNFVYWGITMTPAWAGEVATAEVAAPDLSGLTGFDSRMAPEAHQAIAGGTERLETTTFDLVAGRRTMQAQTGWVLGEYCGDGTVNGGEECDPPDGDTCDDTCHVISGARAVKTSSARRTSVTRKVGIQRLEGPYMVRE